MKIDGECRFESETNRFFELTSIGPLASDICNGADS